MATQPTAARRALPPRLVIAKLVSPPTETATMNSILLLLIAIPAAAFGYRFYAKLLALAVYTLDDNYSTPARERPDAYDQVPTNPHFLFGHHVAAISGLTVAGAATALVWGWAPVFLWVVAGTAIGAGALGMAGLWLSVRRPAAGLYGIAVEFSGRIGAYGFFGVGFVLLLALNVCAAGIAALLLAAYPNTALPFAALLLLGAGLGRYLHGRRESALPPASLAALALALSAVYAFGDWPLAFSGALQLDVSGVSLLTLDTTAAWMTLLLVYGFFAARAPVWKLSRPRSYLTALLALVALGIWCAGLVVTHPAVIAPEFHHAPDAPRVFPWLFVTLAGGTLAGFHFMIANGVTAKQMKREGQARYLGYGGALLDGLLALAAIVVVATAFGDTTAWRDAHASWSSALDFPRTLARVVEGVANYGAAVGVSVAYGRTLAALVLIGLSVATLEAGVRVLKHLLLEVAATTTPPIADAPVSPARLLMKLNERGGLHLAFWLSLLLALTIGRNLSAWWLLFGTANLLYAGLALLLVAAAVRAAGRPALLVGGPALLALVPAGWALVLTMIEGVDAGRWLHALTALALSVAAAVVVWQTAPQLWQASALAGKPPGAQKNL